MNTFSAFTWAFFRGARNRFLALTLFGELKAALFLFIGTAFSAALFFFFWRLISYLDSVAMIGPALSGKFVSLVCLSVWWMSVFSSLNAAYGHFYFASDTAALMSWPLPFAVVTSVKLFRVFRDSSTTALAAMVPLVAAFGVSRSAPVSFYAQSFAGLAPFFFSAAAIGVVAVISVSALFPASKVRRLIWVMLAASGSAIYVLIRMLEPERLVRPDSLEFVAEYLSFLETPAASNLPSGIYYAIMAKSSGGGFNAFGWLALASVCAALYAVVFVMAASFWVDSLANKNDNARSGGFSPSDKSRGPSGEIMALDAKVFFREPQRWSQIMLVAGLFAVYLASAARIPADTFYLKAIVAFMNVGLVGFVAAALSLRFVFAAFSEESGFWWALVTAPLAVERIVQAKFLSRAALVFVATSALYALTAGLLAIPSEAALAGLGFASGIALCVSSAAVYFGIRFPKKIFSSTAEIEGSNGGLFYVAASLFYVALNLALAAGPFRAYYMDTFSSSPARSGDVLMAAAAAMFIINAVLAYFFYRKSVAAARVYE
jgi:hypothetical protein